MPWACADEWKFDGMGEFAVCQALLKCTILDSIAESAACQGLPGTVKSWQRGMDVLRVGACVEDWNVDGLGRSCCVSGPAEL